jgi:hypothetical protein
MFRGVTSRGPQPVAKFIVPDWGDIVDSGIGFSYRPAGLCSLAGRYVRVDFIPPVIDYEFGYKRVLARNMYPFSCIFVSLDMHQSNVRQRYG